MAASVISCVRRRNRKWVSSINEYVMKNRAHSWAALIVMSRKHLAGEMPTIFNFMANICVVVRCVNVACGAGKRERRWRALVVCRGFEKSCLWRRGSSAIFARIEAATGRGSGQAL